MEYISQERFDAEQLLQRVQLEQEKGYKVSTIGTCKEKWWVYFYVIVGLIPIIGVYGTIMLIIAGWPNFKGKTVLRNEGGFGVNRIPDNRYKEGYRLETGTQGADTVVVRPYPEEEEQNKSIGRKFVFGGLALIAVRYFIIYLISLVSQ